MAFAAIDTDRSFDVTAPAEAAGHFGGFFDTFFERVHELFAREVGCDEDARLLTAEALARAVEHPLWLLSMRHGLPLEPLVRSSMQEVLGAYDAGWRPAVA